MAVADKYTREHSFFEDATNNPTQPLPGARVDAELDAAGRSINQLVTALSKIQADDHTLQNGVVLVRNLSQEVLDLIGAGGGGTYVPNDPDDPDAGGTIVAGAGITFFRQALDTPNSYVGAAGRLLRVNSSESGLEFADEEAQEVRFDDLTDAPDLDGNAGKVLQVNQAGDGLVFAVLDLENAAKLDADNDFAGNKQSNMTMGLYHEAAINLGQISGNVDVDLTAGNVFTAEVTGDTFWSLTGAAPAGRAISFTIRIKSAGDNAHTWFGPISWGYDAAGDAQAAPAFPTGSDRTITFILYDDGTVHGFA